MMETVEYRTLIRQTVDLRLAVKNHLINLGSRLMAENLISSYQDEQIRNPQLSASDRAANLVMFIQDKVHEDSQYYHTFMKVLAHNYLLYQPVYMKLQHTYAELQQEQPTLEVSACASKLIYTGHQCLLHVSNIVGSWKRAVHIPLCMGRANICDTNRPFYPHVTCTNVNNNWT